MRAFGALLVLLSTVASLGGCGDPKGAAGPSTETIPHPSTAAMETVVQEQIQGSRRTLEEALANPETERKGLAWAFGDLGLIYHAYGLTPAAAACYANAQQLQPEEPFWAYAAGRIQLDTEGRLEAAEAQFRKALDLESESLAPRLYLGRTLLRLQRPEEAAAEFRKVAEKAPTSAAAADGLGRAAADQRAFREAADQFRRALALQPEATRIYYRLSQALRRAGQLEEARRALAQQGPTEVAFRDRLQEELARKARGVAAAIRWGGVAQLAGDLEGAAQAFQHALSLAPEDAAAHQGLGGILANQGDSAGAIEQYRRAAAVEPENATHRYNLGQLLLQTGRLDEAEVELRKALELEPSLQDAHLTLASVFEERRNFEAALAQYDRVLAADPAHLQARTWRGVLFARIGNEERALAELGELTQAAPNFPQAHLQLGILLARIERWDSARNQFQEVLRLEPPVRIRNSARKSLQTLDRHRAESLARAGRYLAAADAYRAMIDAGGGDPTTRLAEATALVLHGGYADGLERLEEGLGKFPSNPELQLALALLLATAPDASIREPRRALEIAERTHRSSSSLESAETLAMALAANGRYPEAARWQQQVLEAAEPLRQPALLAKLRGNLERYKKGQPAANPFRP